MCIDIDFSMSLYFIVNYGRLLLHVTVALRIKTAYVTLNSICRLFLIKEIGSGRVPAQNRPTSIPLSMVRFRASCQEV